MFYGYIVKGIMYCIKQITPPVRTLFCPTFSIVKQNSTNKKMVTFSNNNEVYIIQPSTHEMKR